MDPNSKAKAYQEAINSAYMALDEVANRAIAAIFSEATRLAKDVSQNTGVPELAVLASFDSALTQQIAAESALREAVRMRMAEARQDSMQRMVVKDKPLVEIAH